VAVATDGNALDQDRPYWVLLSTVAGIGPTRFGRLLELFGSARAAWHAPTHELVRAGLERRTVAGLGRLRVVTTPDVAMAQLDRLGVRPLTLLDDRYPSRLRQIPDPPPVLFVRGALEPADELAVALVGTRRASTYGRTVAERFAQELATAGVTVVSGLARGIDTVAHRATLDAGGRTVAVLGNGLDQVYPTDNTLLARRIAAEGRGALVSEFAPGVPPDAVNFPRRNRIIAGLALATVIIEAGEHSGALITADFALEQGREVMAVPGNVLSPLSVGTNTLIRQGATPVASAAEVLESLGLHPAAAMPAGQTRPLPLLDADEAAMLEVLGREPRHVDEVARALGRRVSDVSAALALLEIKGLARHVGAMAYVQA
jgi:DNA processing protein